MVDTRLVYLEPGKITIDRTTLPELKPNEVLIETYQASICGSERYFYQGITVRPQDEARGGPETQLGAPPAEGRPRHAYPMGPLGHEGGGTIVEVGSAVDEYLGGGKVKVGDRVGSLVYPTFVDFWVTDNELLRGKPRSIGTKTTGVAHDEAVYSLLHCLDFEHISVSQSHYPFYRRY